MTLFPIPSTYPPPPLSLSLSLFLSSPLSHLVFLFPSLYLLTNLSPPSFPSFFLLSTLTLSSVSPSLILSFPQPPHLFSFYILNRLDQEGQLPVGVIWSSGKPRQAWFLSKTLPPGPPSSAVISNADWSTEICHSDFLLESHVTFR